MCSTEPVTDKNREKMQVVSVLTRCSNTKTSFAVHKKTRWRATRNPRKTWAVTKLKAPLKYPENWENFASNMAAQLPPRWERDGDTTDGGDGKRPRRYASHVLRSLRATHSNALLPTLFRCYGDGFPLTSVFSFPIRTSFGFPWIRIIYLL